MKMKMGLAMRLLLNINVVLDSFLPAAHADTGD